jgi:uncharacterized protein YsxB (DUF464 family)
LIRATCSVDNDFVLNELTIDGHSGFAASGSDIVCAAVSILSHALHCGLRTVPGIDISVVDNATYTLTVRDVRAEVKSEIRGMTVLVTEGLKSLASQYPDHVELHIIRS